jgi:pSer/pThr/pTyr-binding forkhead associated (FHA) protein
VGATFAIRRRPRVLAYLIEREGESVGRVHQLEDDVTELGRDPRNHIVLGDVVISAFHARVERGPDGSFLVQDRQSTNGTFVNGELVTQMRVINENDALRLGNTTLVLKLVS